MKILKRVLIGILILALVAGGAWRGLVYLQNANQQEVMVVSVSSLASDYYSQSTSLEGQIVTNVSQNVSMDDDMIIDEVYVSEGSAVSVGDPLISFDMTLVEMELNIARLTKQQKEQQLQKAVDRLESLRNGGPILEDSDDDYMPGDTLIGTDSIDEMASLAAGRPGGYLAAALYPVLAAAFGDGFTDGNILDGFTDGGNSGDGYGEGNLPDAEAADPGGNGGDFSGNPQDDGNIPQGSEGAPVPTPNPAETPDSVDIPVVDSEQETPELTPGPTEEPAVSPEPTEEPAASPEPTETPAVNPEPTENPEVVVWPEEDAALTPLPEEEEIIVYPAEEEQNKDFTDGDYPFYQVLDDLSEPYRGTGTEEDPFVFLCSCAKGSVTLKGSFFNKMAGFNGEGTAVEFEGGYWFRLEFHEYDTVNFESPESSCTGYYLIDGGMLEEPVDPELEVVYTLEDAQTYSPQEPDEDYDYDYDYDYDIDGDEEPDVPMSREDAIRIQQNLIASLKLDIEASDINIKKLENKVKRKVSYSRLDGTVTHVGDSVTDQSSGQAFITVNSKEGFYVQGTVGEMMLDQLTEGTVLQCMSYEHGNFEAEVIDVSEYPVSAYSYYGDGNPNVSYYSFSAVIPDKSVQVSDMDWLTISLQSDLPSQDSIVLEKAFVRTENGRSYVYKDDNGVLKKQFLSVGGNVNGGYSVLIKGGITQDDKIAFPYGKAVREGAKTKDATLDQLYGY